MFKAMRRFLKGQRGVTLVEMLIVLAVIGTLSAIVVPNVTGFLGGSKKSAYRGDRDQLQSSVDGWRGTSHVNDTSAGGAKKWPSGYPVVWGAAVTTCTDGNPATTSNKCYIDIAELANQGFIPSSSKVNSADTTKNTTATNSPKGSYGWYIDSSGLVTSDPAFVEGTYP